MYTKIKHGASVVLGVLFLAPSFVLPIIWYGYLIAPFDNFTFTDAPDFIFAGLINVTLIFLIWRHVKKPYPPKWIRFASVAAFVLAVTTPLIPLITLYALSWRAETLIRHWPRMMINDPKWIGHDDAIYQTLGHTMTQVEAFVGWGLIAWAALILHLRRSLPLRQLCWHIGVFWLAWVIFAFEPGGRFWWWMD